MSEPQGGHGRDRRKRTLRGVGLASFVAGLLLAAVGFGGLLPGGATAGTLVEGDSSGRAVLYLVLGLVLTAAGGVLGWFGSQGVIGQFSAGEGARRRRCRACDTMNAWHAERCTSCGSLLF